MNLSGIACHFHVQKKTRQVRPNFKSMLIVFFRSEGILDKEFYPSRPY
jgi:hypothetical protein